MATVRPATSSSTESAPGIGHTVVAQHQGHCTVRWKGRSDGAPPCGSASCVETTTGNGFYAPLPAAWRSSISEALAVQYRGRRGRQTYQPSAMEVADEAVSATMP